MRKLSLLILSASLSFFACKPLPPFHVDRPFNEAAQFSQLGSRIKPLPLAPSNSTGKPLVVMQTRMPVGAVAVDPETGKVLWKTPTPNAHSRYVISGGAVAFHDSKKGIVGLDVSSGKILWTYKLPSGHKFLGMSGSPSGKLGIVSIYKPMGSVLNQTSTLHLLRASSGSKIYEMSTNGRMGWPTVTDSAVLVPYRSHYLVFLDTQKPVELARLHITKGEIRYIKHTSRGLFFGDKYGVYALSGNVLKKLDKGKASFTTDVKNLEYRYAINQYDPVMTNYSAYDVRLIHGELTDTDSIATFENKEFVFNMFKYFFGFQITDKGKALLKWAVSSDLGGVVAVKHEQGVIYYVSSEGAIHGLNRSTGEMVFSTPAIGESIKGATFDIRGFKPASNVTPTKKSLLDSLTDIANDTDTRFPLAKRFAIDALAVVGGAGVSRLIKLITSAQSSPELKEKAEHDLVAHPDPKGLPLYLDLLKRSYDYIQGSRPLAVDVMAKVCAKLKAKESVPILIGLLRHAQTTKKELIAITDALLAIGDKRAIRAFREFLLAYRADPEFAREIHALQKMAEGLFALGGPRERQVLTFLAEDHRTLPRLREYVVRMLRETRKKAKK
ncbi:PQQ-binding-like beta-propeller repeat protein [Myxococcota bacterium]|nr:PQQ-binding-like beta-propeller repeat protein [Myxococcota bacterium]MBU1537830.1 PQQ-binding-like beta-propeller repeat protein [Myxococcota bacterium]